MAIKKANSIKDKNGDSIQFIPPAPTDTELGGISKASVDKIDTISTDLGSKTSASGVTGDDAFSKINTLNNALTNLRLDWFTLYNGTAPTAGGIYTLHGGRKFTDYPFIILYAHEGGIVRNTSVIPTSLFRYSHVQLDYSNPSTTRWVEFGYQSDTQVYVKSANANVTCYVMGVNLVK